jgi:hypothetical protein
VKSEKKDADVEMKAPSRKKTRWSATGADAKVSCQAVVRKFGFMSFMHLSSYILAFVSRSIAPATAF